ncbi:MAG: phosphomannomutase/phosphoglucomutase, partial [Cyanobacteria bacterium J06633_2]
MIATTSTDHQNREQINWKKLQNGSDIRGVAMDGVPGETVNLTPAIAYTLGQAFAAWLGETLDKSPSDLTISIGRDSRLSGPELLTAVANGMMTIGVSVYTFGMASTPAMFMSTVNPDLTCDGAIMMTASHLPFNRNGLKFFTAQGGLGKPDIARILSLAETRDFQAASTPGTLTEYDFISVYADTLVNIIRQGV